MGVLAVFLYFKPKVLVIVMLGVASGLPLSLSASTLSAMLMDTGIGIAKIAIFGLASTPYAFKYLWSPLVDNLSLPILSKVLGRRTAWLLLTQILLFFTITFVGFYAAQAPNLFILGAGVFCIAFLSATQDIIIDAYRIEILTDEEQGSGAAAVTFGYRIGMLISSAGSLFIAEYLNWAIAYSSVALFLIPGALAALAYGEPSLLRRSRKVYSNFIAWLRHSFADPFIEFIKQRNWFVIICLVLLYKLSDAYIGMLTTPFLMDIGFSRVEIASIIKLYGFLTTIVGMFIGGYLIAKYQNMGFILVLGLILQCVSNLVFVVQASYGNDPSVLIAVISVENFCSGLSNASLVAYISTVVKKEFAATHYAILSSLAVVGRTVISSSAGFVVSILGWINFFYFSALLSLPAFICLYYLYYRKNK
ncbi:MAG: MFS transporter [Candidatus Midichloria mitochondrii]|nr:MFS transporter [Candidatus Midichloria mitochondrii]MDJ1298924.1 MFS transporter [Candidatus Midichloria mitochondrii]MDJ1313087.1 MFS transporter [Candidatus Midichloria mitochondrii]